MVTHGYPDTIPGNLFPKIDAAAGEAESAVLDEEEETVRPRAYP